MTIWAKTAAIGAALAIAPMVQATSLPTVASEDQQLPLLRVLSFNINALPDLLKSGGQEVDQYQRIAEILRERRAKGTHPQIVVLQEVFDNKASVIAETTGYAYVVKGPGRREASKKGKAHWSMRARKTYTNFDDPQKLTGSGLVILSDFPVLEAQHKAFDSDMCAGFDCLANKAIQMVRVAVPGLDRPLDIINSHFNSRRSAAAPKKLVFRAHQRQTETLEWFMHKLDQGNPLVLAGDFNTREKARYRYFRERIDLTDSAEACLAMDGTCVVDSGTKVEEVLYDTNDKHFFVGSDCHGLTPVHIVRNFTEMVNGKPLSDHLGYEVHYRVGPHNENETNKEFVWSSDSVSGDLSGTED